MHASALLTPPKSDSLDHLRWPSDEARTWVRGLLRQATNDPATLAIVLYGSAVRGVGEPGDVDLLMIRRGAWRDTDVPLDVDFRVFGHSDIEARIGGGDEVLGWALRLGVPVFERDDWWSALVARWHGRLPLPSADAADERARRAERAAKGLRESGDVDAAEEVRLTALTQRARSKLVRAGVFPLSRPELPEQLIAIGEHGLAAELDPFVAERR